MATDDEFGPDADDRFTDAFLDDVMLVLQRHGYTFTPQGAPLRGAHARDVRAALFDLTMVYEETPPPC